MEVRLAKTAGFCFGVKRAVDTVYEQVKLNDILIIKKVMDNIVFLFC